MGIVFRDGSSGIEIVGKAELEFTKILTPEAAAFVAELHREFNPRRKKLLARRAERQAGFNSGKPLNFLRHTADIRRDEEWKINPLPKIFWDPGVEITGPASSRKMVINALNSGAEVYMADSEDSESPTWKNIMSGQVNLHDAVRRKIDFETPEKKYQLDEKTAALFYRPRGWHLEEAHMLVNCERVSASLFDFGLYFFHNARILFWHGHGPNFYLPKLESRLEARLWNDVFSWAEDRLRLPSNVTKAVVLIETLPAAFEMDEILFELRTHSAGLNCGRWDYIFSYIKKLNAHPGFVLPDRSLLTMDQPFLSAYANLLVKTCQKRCAPAIGGMSAYIPIKDNPEENAKAMAKVRADKAMEKKKGFVRAWVAHPGMVALVREIMRLDLNDSERIDLKAVSVSSKDLTLPPVGERTEAGLRANISIALRYIQSWLKGTGCAALNNLMEDAATAEISRSLIQQWMRHDASLTNGRRVNYAYVNGLIDEEARRLKMTGLLDLYAIGLLSASIATDKFLEFLTFPGYETLIDLHRPMPEPEYMGSPT